MSNVNVPFIICVEGGKEKFFVDFYLSAIFFFTLKILLESLLTFYS